jgi:hypothetical protein
MRCIVLVPFSLVATLGCGILDSGPTFTEVDQLHCTQWLAESIDGTSVPTVDAHGDSVLLAVWTFVGPYSSETGEGIAIGGVRRSSEVRQSCTCWCRLTSPDHLALCESLVDCEDGPQMIRPIRGVIDGDRLTVSDAENSVWLHRRIDDPC